MKKIPTQEKCQNVSELLKILAHPQRLMILCQLSDGPKTVGELESLTHATQSAVSQFLTRMKLEGLVTNRRKGQFVVYQVADSKIKRLLQSLYKIYCE
jgi:ArsR family transcriptional regulator